MAATPSTMLPLGSPCPAFSLSNAVDGAAVSPADYGGAPALLVMFICNHCPFVIHVRDELGRVARDYRERGLAIIAINSNSEKTHPQDGPRNMGALARQLEWRFPFVFDGTQQVAKAFHAACTPDFYLFDQARKLVYRGQLDDSRPGNSIPVTGRDLRAAIDAALAGGAPIATQKPSIGCNIKWDRGNEPDYYG